MIRPAFVLCAAFPALAASGVLQNRAYRVELDGTTAVVTRGGAARRFEPRFVVLRAESNPGWELRWGKFPGREVQYNVSTWKTGAGPESAVRTGHVEDGFNPLVDRATGADRTADAFAAAPGIVLTAQKASISASSIEWGFVAQPAFRLTARLELPGGDAEPLLRFEFTPLRDGWYSVAYTGAPETPPPRVDEMWQPLIWQELRFPDQPYLTESYRCPLPGTMVTESGVTTSVMADPAELPFQPMPTLQNTGFGVAVRNRAGNAQPMLFAPILGGPRSHMTAGAPFSFRLRLIVNRGSVWETYRYIGTGLYDAHDYRRNSAVSLNKTFENMVDYAMSSWARFNDELRGAAYDTDVPGSVKNISALHPLATALVTDDEQIWQRRARPMIEYGISREKFLFTIDPNVKGQGASSNLTGPGVPLSEVAALYSMSTGRSGFLLQLAESLFTRKRNINLDADLNGGWWANYLALYRASGDQSWLDKARAGADAYIARRIARKQTDFADPDSRGMFFWTSYVPQWADLYELWQETHERRYLEASMQGAREYTEDMWLCPVIPKGDVLVNEGGRAPLYRKSEKLRPIFLPEERIPAWRVSEIGLTSESSGTSKGHRGILLASFAPYFLRLGLDGNDDFLRMLGRSAVVGRYTNFPGYHMNTARTTVYEKPDFPLRPMAQLNSTTSLHYNHIWAQIAMVLDYLVSDAVTRSRGQIDFPSQFAEGYAYATSKVYGDRPGMFYGDRNVWLWMPKGLAAIDNIQLNYIAARGNGKLYLALTNQLPQPVTSRVRLNRELVPFQASHRVSVRAQDGASSDATLRDGAVEVSVAPNGITSLEIDGLEPAPKFQGKLGGEPREIWRKDAVAVPLGGTHAMLLNFGPELKSIYVYLQANSNEVSSATLRYSTGGEWKQIGDNSFPYEYTVPLGRDDREFRFRIEVKRKDGSVASSEEAKLER